MRTGVLRTAVLAAVIGSSHSVGARELCPLDLSVNSPVLIAAVQAAPSSPSPAPPAETDPHPIHWAVAAFIAANAADTAITYHLLARHADVIQEANPLLSELSDRPMILALTKTGVVLAASYLLIHEHKDRPWVTFWIAGAGAAFYSYLAIHNWQLNP